MIPNPHLCHKGVKPKILYKSNAAFGANDVLFREFDRHIGVVEAKRVLGEAYASARTQHRRFELPPREHAHERAPVAGRLGRDFHQYVAS